jgi:hypothetical protein
MQEAVEAMHRLIERHKISRRCRQGSHPLAGESCPEARALMAPVLGNDRVDRLFDAIRTIEAVADISSLRPLLLKL